VKIDSICLTIIYFCIIAACAGCSPSNRQNKELPALEKQEDFRWPEGKHAAISLTFDDARHSQVTQGLPILDEYGTKATFYVSIRNMEGQLDAWKRAAINGHEIGERGRQTTYSSTLKALCEYAQDPANGLWLDTVQTVANHILKQRTDTREF